MIFYATQTESSALSSRLMSPDIPNDIAREIEKYSKQFLSLAKASTENTVEMCEVLFNAKSELKKKTKSNQLFQQLCHTIGYTKGSNDPTIKKFLRIGQCADQFKPYLDRLPNSWTTLYEITQLDPNAFNRAIENGAINNNMLGKEVKSLKQFKISNSLHINNGLATKQEQTKPSIQIVLDADADKHMLDCLCQELEALKITFKLQIAPNVIAQHILNQVA